MREENRSIKSMRRFLLNEIQNLPLNLIQILDMIGRETTFKPNTPLIYVYDDGSTEKVFSVEY